MKQHIITATWLGVVMLPLGGFLIGGALIALLMRDTGGYERKLRDCARANDVYACEIIAVPKGEKPRP